jgi:hypothetical protein
LLEDRTVPSNLGAINYPTLVTTPSPAITLGTTAPTISDSAEATAEIEPVTGAVVQAFTTGNVVQVFQLVGSVPTETWNGNERNGSP